LDKFGHFRLADIHLASGIIEPGCQGSCRDDCKDVFAWRLRLRIDRIADSGRDGRFGTKN
jgi:hypothetical protein